MSGVLVEIWAVWKGNVEVHEFERVPEFWMQVEQITFYRFTFSSNLEK